MTKLIMQVIVSCVVLAAGWYLVATGDAGQQKLGSGFFGVVTGYWLR